MFDHIAKARKVPGLVELALSQSGDLLSSLTFSELEENWYTLTFWSIVPPGVCPSFPKILGWPNARCNEMIIRYHGGAVEI